MKSNNDKHEYHAMDITGVLNGPILCETRRIAASSQVDDKKAGRRKAQSSSDEPADEPSLGSMS